LNALLVVHDDGVRLRSRRRKPTSYRSVTIARTGDDEHANVDNGLPEGSMPTRLRAGKIFV